MDNWKMKLGEFLKVHKHEYQYEHRDNLEVNELRELRNLFSDEATRIQGLIDEKVLELNDVSKYENQCIKFLDNYGELVYMRIKSIERKFGSVSFTGDVVKQWEPNEIEIGEDTINVLYSKLDKFVTIITETEFKKKTKEIVNNCMKNLNMF